MSGDGAAEEGSTDASKRLAGRRYRGRAPDSRRRERRQKLRAAGLELFGAGPGFAATPVKAVCERAGVSTRHFYEHFSDREALLVDLLDEVGDELMAASFSASSAEAEIGRAVRQGVRAYLEVLSDDRRKARLLFRESIGVSDAVERVRGRIQDGFAAFVRERAMALGAVEEETPQNALLPAGVVGAVHEMANRAFRRPGPLDLDSLTDQCCLVYLAVAERLAASTDSADSGRRPA